MQKFTIASSKRLRKTPYTSRIEKQGVTTYTIYNHMLLPAGFEDSLEDTYYPVSYTHLTLPTILLV